MTTGGGGEFVGRERELGVILDAAARAASGQSAVLLVRGSSGIGSTQLLDEAVRALGAPAGSPATAILRADNLPTWRGAPYAPIRAALEPQLLRRAPAAVETLLGSAAEVLLPVLPAVARHLGVTDPAPGTRQRLSERMQEGVRGVLGRLAADGPVVLVVEDLHVLDAASRSLLAFLARTLGERPVLLVGTYQPDAVGPGHPLRNTLAAIESGPRRPIFLELEPLDRAALRALIAAREREAPSAPVLLLVAERSGGNPLVAEEVLAARRELSGAALSLPLEQLVVARASLRSPECRRVLRILAVADGPLLPDQLREVAGAYDREVGRPAPRSAAAPRRGVPGADAALAAGMDEAVEHGFVEPLLGEIDRAAARQRLSPRRADGRPRAVRIRHELVAAALAADLLPGSRRRMHAAVAAALPAHPAEAGRHWHRAHEPGHEVSSEIAAAEQAEALGAAAGALEHLERAIEVAGAPAAAGAIDVDGELDLVLRAAEAASAAGDTGRAEAYVTSAIARLAPRERREARARLTARLGSFRLARGDHEGAVDAYERALEQLGHVDGSSRAELLATLAQVRMLEGSFSEARTLADEAAAAARDAGPAARAWLGHAICTLGVVDGWLGRPQAAAEKLEEALAIATALGRLDDAFRARANLATVLDLQGRRADAVEVAREGIRAATVAGLEVAHGNLLRGNAADFLISLGQWEEALEMTRRALDWAPSGIPLVNATLGLAFIKTETAADDEAARLLGRLFLELETVPDVQFAVPTYQVAASLALWRGDLADAERAARAAWARVRHTEDWPLVARTATTVLRVSDAQVRALGRRGGLAAISGARSWGAQVLADAERVVVAADVAEGALVRREAAADLATSRAYLQRMRGHDDPAAWSDTADRWRAIDHPYDVARARFHEAEAALDAGSATGERRDGRAVARSPILESAEIATCLGALPLLRALADLAERSRLDLPAGARTALLVTVPTLTEDETAPPARRSPPAGASSADPAATSFGLSPRERGVLAEIVAGRTNRQIGERLFISEKTVGVHVGNILAKLGVGGRVEAATVALRLGLVDEAAARATKPGRERPGFTGRRRGHTA